LQLITRHQVDIYDIPLRVIVDDYLAEIARMESLDLDVATEFLLIAATLIELKTVALLPEPDSVELDEELALWEERDLLISRLLAAKTFKDASGALRQGLEEGAGYFAREVGLEDALLHVCPDLLARVSTWDLARIAGLALTAGPVAFVDLSHMAPVTASVRDAMTSVARSLPGRGTLRLFELARGASSRLDVIVVLLALLELYKQGFVELHQAMTFGSLEAAWTGPDSGVLPDWSGAAEWDEDRVT
jgi:segregation and condensation protein A